MKKREFSILGYTITIEKILWKDLGPFIPAEGEPMRFKGVAQRQVSTEDPNMSRICLTLRPSEMERVQDTGKSVVASRISTPVSPSGSAGGDGGMSTCRARVVEVQCPSIIPGPPLSKDPNIRKAQVLANKYGWREMWHRPDEKRIRFCRDKDTIVDLWYTKMTIGTVLTHPTKGRTQLFRKHANWSMFEEILKNPRVHTNAGYYER